jgi:hypothetical protein
VWYDRYPLPYPAFFPVEMGSYECFCLGWPGSMVFPISASCIAEQGVYYCAQPLFEMGGLRNFLPSLVLNHDSPDLSLLSS